MGRGQLGAVIRHLRKLAGAAKVEELSDGGLLRLFITHKDEAAFAALLERQGPMVLGVCRRLLHHQQDAEDAFQAVFLVLVRRAASISKQESVAGWLYRVAYRVAMKAKLSAARRAARENRAAQPVAVETEAEAEVGWRELRPVLDEELNQLPEKYRAPLVLCYLQGKTYAEAARELGWNKGTLSGRMALARDLLRDRLARRGVTLTAGVLAAVLCPATASAAVPLLLQHTTLRGIMHVVAGKAAAGLLSNQAAELAEAVLKAMFLTKLKTLSVLAVGLTLLVVATTWAVRPAPPAPPDGGPGSQHRGSPDVPRPKPFPKSTGRTDRNGDPLPSGAYARLGTARLRHGSFVMAVAVAPNGKTFASAGLDHTARLWDAATGRELRRFCEPNSGVGLFSVAFSSDGKRLATAGTSICLWNVATGRKLREIQVSHTRILAVAFSPDDKVLAADSMDDAVQLFDPATGKEIRRLAGLRSWVCSLAFSPKGDLLAAGGFDQTVHLWQYSTGNPLPPLRGHTGTVNSVAFAPDGNRLVSGSLDQTVRFWDAAAGTEIRRLPKLAGPVHAVCFSPHGNRLVTTSGHWDNCQASEVKVWDPATGGELLSFAEKKACAHLGAAFAPDGKTLITAGGHSDSVHLWDPATGQEKTPGGAAHRGPITALAYAPDGRTLASAGEHTVRLWDPATARQTRRFEHPDEVMAVAFSPDGQWLASGGLGGRIHLWDAATGNPIRVLRGHRSGDRSRFTLLNGKEIHRWGGGPPSVNSLAFAPDCKTLYSGGKILRRWQIPSGRERVPFPEQEGEVFRIAVSADGRTVAAGLHDDEGPRICLWDAATGQRRRTIASPGKWVTHILFSPDGTQLASSGFDGVVRLWDVRTGKRLHKFVPEARADRQQPNCCCIAFAPDGKTLAAGGWDQTIHLYDVATGREGRSIGGHQGWISALAFAPDGKRLASGSQDTTVLVWDVVAGRK